jgi:hypothetical protein
MNVSSQRNPYEFTEADTCREFVTPAIKASVLCETPSGKRIDFNRYLKLMPDISAQVGIKRV